MQARWLYFLNQILVSILEKEERQGYTGNLINKKYMYFQEASDWRGVKMKRHSPL